MKARAMYYAVMLSLFAGALAAKIPHKVGMSDGGGW